MITRPSILAIAMVFWVAVSVASPAQTEPSPSGKDSTSALDGDRVEIAEFLGRYCVRCHGPESADQKPKGNLSLHDVGAKVEPGRKADMWNAILDKLKRREMPPENASQPTPDERAKVTGWIKRALRTAGAPVDEDKWLHPSRGNWVDHASLFSGKASGKSATRGRLWRLTGEAYVEFIQGLNVKYRLGFRTYGHSRVRSPWELSPHEGFRDYASQHRIGEPEIEHHLRNATRVARAMIEKLPKTRIAELKPLVDLLKAGDAYTADQVAAATDAAFDGILGRPPTREERKRYAGFLEGTLKKLGTDRGIDRRIEQGLEQLLTAILFHPEVMYRIELPIAGEKRTMLPPRDLARAIAYALSDREGDAALRHAAETGKLTRREEVRTQVDRILADPQIAKPRILRFFQEYFGYTKAIDVFKDEATRKAAGLRGKNDWHPNFFVSDTDRLILWVLARDSNVLREMLTTSKTFAVTGDTKEAEGIKRNPTKPFSQFAQTALDIYEIEIERKDWSDERPFEMPRKNRMGVLTHPSWLIAHSTNFDNHAIHRGRWIRERLLGGRIPDLPVTVDAQLPDEPENPLRRRMRVTREQYCWKCHQSMDPLGLPLEQFDHFGRFRTMESNKPVDTTGAIERSGEAGLDGPVRDPFELIEKLASSRRVEQVFVRHVFRYFVGRNETEADGPSLVAAHRAYVDGGGSMNALIASLLTSDAFLYRANTISDP